MVKYVALEEGFRLRVEELAEGSMDLMVEYQTVSQEWENDYGILPDVMTIHQDSYFEVLMQIKDDVHNFAESIH